VIRRREIILVLVVLCASGCAGRRDPGTSSREISTERVVPARFEISLPVVGELDAADQTPVISRYTSGSAKWVINDGTRVKVGDLIMAIATPDIEKRINDLELELKRAEDSARDSDTSNRRQVENAKATQSKAYERMRLSETEATSEMEKAQAQISFAQKELEVAQKEVAKRKRLSAEKIVPLKQVEDAEDTAQTRQFDLEKANRALADAQQKWEIQQKANQLDTDKAAAELKNAEIRVQQVQTNSQIEIAQTRMQLADQQQALAGAQIRAPVAGMVLLENTWDEGVRPLRAGDQIRDRQQVASIIGMRKMLARCDVAELHLAHVKVGQEVKLRVPAIAGKVFPGKVAAVENLVRSSDPRAGELPGKRVFSVTVELSRVDPRLRPGMTVGMEIILSKTTQGQAVPVQCLFRRGHDWVVYRQRSNRFEPVPVKLGRRSDLLVTVEGYLRVGDRVASSVPDPGLLVGKRQLAKR
jgi:multidrug efflux pump subunit AcrA (membrane-fusion protein)